MQGLKKYFQTFFLEKKVTKKSVLLLFCLNSTFTSLQEKNSPSAQTTFLATLRKLEFLRKIKKAQTVFANAQAHAELPGLKKILLDFLIWIFLPVVILKCKIKNSIYALTPFQNYFEPWLIGNSKIVQSGATEKNQIIKNQRIFLKPCPDSYRDWLLFYQEKSDA